MAKPMTGKLGQLLIDAGKLTQEQLDEALQKQRSSGTRLGQALVELGFVTEEDLIQVLGEQMGVPHVWLRKGLIDPKVVEMIPREKAELYKAIAMFKVRDTLTVAMTDPQSLFVIDALSRLTGCTIQPVVCRANEIAEFIREYYENAVGVDELLSSLDTTDVEVIEDAPDISFSELEEMADGSPIINLVNVVVLNAIKEGASDIHIEPDRKKMRVRCRVDGVMREVMSNRIDLHPAVISRVKVMAKMDIGERRRPQEGRIHVSAEGREIDLRVSSLPTVLGEKIVMRVLDQAQAVTTLDRLGFYGHTKTVFEGMLTKPFGLLLVTGPTGSGKTTTLYSALSILSSVEKNLLTIEDPVEYQLEMINQIQVNEAMNLSFANILRHVLRQDPDVIMVGEIRDVETAQIAIQAALTGHLVISTLHTNDSAGTITRLADMGVDSYLIASALLGAIAQRLVRSICPECKSSFVPPPSLLAEVGWPPGDKVTMCTGAGCQNCYDSGYKGRKGIYEILEMDADMRKLVLSNISLDDLRAARNASSLPSLKESGFELVRRGESTIEEVMRAVFIESQSDVQPELAPLPAGEPEPVNVSSASPAEITL